MKQTDAQKIDQSYFNVKMTAHQFKSNILILVKTMVKANKLMNK